MEQRRSLSDKIVTLEMQKREWKFYELYNTNTSFSQEIGEHAIGEGGMVKRASSVVLIEKALCNINSYQSGTKKKY